jgi:hypothetical protein
MKTGRSTPKLYTQYPKKLGIFTPRSSAIAARLKRALVVVSGLAAADPAQNAAYSDNPLLRRVHPPAHFCKSAVPLTTF